MTGEKPRLLFHAQHLLGIGHRIRARHIADAAANAGFSVLLLEGGMPTGPSVPASDPTPGIEIFQLSPVRASDAAFTELLDGNGRPITDQWRADRRHAVLSALQSHRPHVVLVEGYPFARRKFAFELDPLLRHARDIGAKTACSIRDILVAKPDRRKTAKIAEIARRSYDRILVHGDPDIAPLSASFSATAAVADRLVYTGYVGGERSIYRNHDNSGHENPGPIVVSAGGGAVGGALYRAAMEICRDGAFPDRPWHFLIGRNLPETDFLALEDMRKGLPEPRRVHIEPARPDFQALLAAASLSISQAGYNTILDLASAGCRAVLVPFEGDGETEQPLRAELLRQRGLVHVIPEPKLSSETLRETVQQAMAIPPPPQFSMPVNGASKAADILLSLAQAARLA